MIIDWQVYPWHGAQSLTLGRILNWVSGEILLEILAVRTYTIEIRNGDGDLIAILENAHGIGYMQEINAPHSLRFELPATDSKAENILLANEYWLRDNRTGIVIRKFKLRRKVDLR